MNAVQPTTEAEAAPWGQGGSAEPPRVLFVNVTRRCNVDCPRCYITPEHRAGRDALGPELLHKALSDPFFRDHAGEVLVIYQGGEPQLVGRAALTEMAAAAEEACPGARQTAVSNMATAAPWFLELAWERFGGRIETTWAAARKSTLSGDEGRYQALFARSMRAAAEAGLACPVNVELNAETVAAGPERLIEAMASVGARVCEFDLSFDFAAFRSAPVFGPGGYPVLPPTVSYAKVADFLVGLRRALALSPPARRFESHSLVPPYARGLDLPFNTLSEERFVTLNPDGTITTVPLYSDVEETYLGRLQDSPLSAILAHPHRALRAQVQRDRLRACVGCRHLPHCQGGPGHAPWGDGSGVCAGLRPLLDRLAPRL